MTEGRNVARADVLIELAEDLVTRDPAVADLDLDRFRSDLAGDAALAAFRADFQETRYHEIGRFPTLILRGPADPSIMIVGYRPYEILCRAIHELAPELVPPTEVEA